MLRLRQDFSLYEKGIFFRPKKDFLAYMAISSTSV